MVERSRRHVALGQATEATRIGVIVAGPAVIRDVRTGEVGNPLTERDGRGRVEGVTTSAIGGDRGDRKGRGRRRSGAARSPGAE